MNRSDCPKDRTGEGIFVVLQPQTARADARLLTVGASGSRTMNGL